MSSSQSVYTKHYLRPPRFPRALLQTTTPSTKQTRSVSGTGSQTKSPSTTLIASGSLKPKPQMTTPERIADSQRLCQHARRLRLRALSVTASVTQIPVGDAESIAHIVRSTSMSTSRTPSATQNALDHSEFFCFDDAVSVVIPVRCAVWESITDWHVVTEPGSFFVAVSRADRGLRARRRSQGSSPSGSQSQSASATASQRPSPSLSSSGAPTPSGTNSRSASSTCTPSAPPSGQVNVIVPMTVVVSWKRCRRHARSRHCCSGSFDRPGCVCWHECRSVSTLPNVTVRTLIAGDGTVIYDAGSSRRRSLQSSRGRPLRHSIGRVHGISRSRRRPGLRLTFSRAMRSRGAFNDAASPALISAASSSSAELRAAFTGAVVEYDPSSLAVMTPVLSTPSASPEPFFVQTFGALFSQVRAQTWVRAVSQTLLSKSAVAMPIPPVALGRLVSASSAAGAPLPVSAGAPVRASDPALRAAAQQASSAAAGDQIFAPWCGPSVGAWLSSAAGALSNSTATPGSDGALAARVSAGEAVVLLADLYLVNSTGQLLARPAPVNASAAWLPYSFRSNSTCPSLTRASPCGTACLDSLASPRRSRTQRPPLRQASCSLYLRLLGAS